MKKYITAALVLGMCSAAGARDVNVLEWRRGQSAYRMVELTEPGVSVFCNYHTERDNMGFLMYESPRTIILREDGKATVHTKGWLYDRLSEMCADAAQDVTH